MSSAGLFGKGSRESTAPLTFYSHNNVVQSSPFSASQFSASSGVADIEMYLASSTPARLDSRALSISGKSFAIHDIMSTQPKVSPCKQNNANSINFSFGSPTPQMSLLRRPVTTPTPQRRAENNAWTESPSLSKPHSRQQPAIPVTCAAVFSCIPDVVPTSAASRVFERAQQAGSDPAGSPQKAKVHFRQTPSQNSLSADHQQSGAPNGGELLPVNVGQPGVTFRHPPSPSPHRAQTPGTPKQVRKKKQTLRCY